MRIVVALTGCLLLLTTAMAVGADTRYVSDRLIITLRAGTGPNAEVITTLATDDSLEVLAEEGPFLKVRTPDGTEGYVQGQYITRETPKSTIIARLEKERDQLKSRLAQLEKGKTGIAEEAKAIKEEAAKSEADLAKTQKELQAITGKYDTLLENSKQVLEITSERDRLHQENARLAAEVKTLGEENADLLRKGMIQWFLAGGGVFLFGWLIGKISRKKKRGF
jgi:SH3 domain protein